MKPRRKARIHESCRSPGIHQEREWPFATDADVGDDGGPDDPYRHDRGRTGRRRTGFLEHGQLYATDRGRRRPWRSAAATPGEEGGGSDDNERVSNSRSSAHFVPSFPFIVPPRRGAAVGSRCASTPNPLLCARPKRCCLVRENGQIDG